MFICAQTQTHIPQGSRVRKTSWEKDYLFSQSSKKKKKAYELARQGGCGRLFQVALFLGRDGSQECPTEYPEVGDTEC